MKVLLCSSENGINAGGLAFHCAQLKEIYEELGHQVMVEVLGDDEGFSVIDGGYDPKLGQKLRSSYELKSLIRKYDGKAELCVSCGGGRTAYYAMLICRAIGIPLYVVLCGSEVNLAFEDTQLAYFNAEALGYASKVIGLSEELNANARILCKSGNSQYYVVPNYYDFAPFSETKHKTDHEDVIFASGAAYLNEKKGISNLIHAFSKYINTYSRKDKLYLFGKVDEDIRAKYEQIIAENAMDDHIYLCGYLDRDSFKDRLNNTDVYIQASPFEGLCNSVAEAISLGTDILISDTGFIAEQIRGEYPDHIIASLSIDDITDSFYGFVTRIIRKCDAERIHSFLQQYLDKAVVKEQWNMILGETVPPRKPLDEKCCMAVMFHDISNEHSGIDYSCESFRTLVDILAADGYALCSARKYFASNSEYRRKAIICTFDDGYENVYLNAFPILKEYGFSATVYMCPDHIGKSNDWNHKDKQNRKHLTDDMLVALSDAGWEIGSHGLSHMNLMRLSEHEIDRCLIDSKAQLEKYGPVESFCYPYGEYNQFIMKKVKEHYLNAFSVSIGGYNYIKDSYQITRMDPEELIRELEIEV